MELMVDSPSTKRITLAGCGSLVSKKSARKSFPFSNFRLGEVRGWRRAFNQANWVNVALGIARVETGEVAALAMIPAAPDFVSKVVLLDVEEEDLQDFYEREAGYKILQVPFTAPGGESGDALLCTACENDLVADAMWSPGGDMESHCRGSEYVATWMRYSLRPLWPSFPERLPLQPRDSMGNVVCFNAEAMVEVPAEHFPLIEGRAASSDSTSTRPQYPPQSGALYPAPGYLRSCAAAHHTASLLDHFLDTTVLADGQTVLRTYLEANPELAHYVWRGVEEGDDDV